MLKEQLNKCKWFFSKLANNPVWQDYPNEFLPHSNDSNENSQSEENHSNNNYSMSNDSVCSSWDEIDESDYKLVAWVPDFYGRTHVNKMYFNKIIIFILFQTFTHLSYSLSKLQ